MLIVLFLLAAIALLFLWPKEKSFYSHTLGTYGQAEPDTCFETEPVGPLNECRAASLACSSYASWQALQQCMACQTDKTMCRKKTVVVHETPQPNVLKINVM